MLIHGDLEVAHLCIIEDAHVCIIEDAPLLNIEDVQKVDYVNHIIYS